MSGSSTQGFSQKAVQPSYGRPFLEEIQGKCTYSLIILWENMPSGWPIFNVWLKACFHVQNCPTQCQQSTVENNWSVILTTNLMGLKSNSSIFKACTTSDKQISRTFQEFFKDKLQFSRTTIFLLNRRHSLTPFDHPIG